MSRVFMLKPADGIEGVKEAILTTVKGAGPNACPPIVVGVGIGGTFEKCTTVGKRGINKRSREHTLIFRMSKRWKKNYLQRSTVLESDREVLEEPRRLLQ